MSVKVFLIHSEIRVPKQYYFGAPVTEGHCFINVIIKEKSAPGGTKMVYILDTTRHGCGQISIQTETDSYKEKACAVLPFWSSTEKT